MSHEHLGAFGENQYPPYYVQSDAATAFLSAVAINDVVFGTIPANTIADTFSAQLKVPRIMIVGMFVVSVQNLPWSIWLASLHTSSLGIPFQGRYDFTVADGRQIAGAGVFYYDRPVSRVFPPMPYETFVDQTTTTGASTLRLGISVNGGGVAKLADAAGAISVKLLYIPAGE